MGPLANFADLDLTGGMNVSFSSTNQSEFGLFVTFLKSFFFQFQPNMNSNLALDPMAGMSQQMKKVTILINFNFCETFLDKNTWKQ